MSDAEPLASRREMDQLRERVDRIDDHGSRGVGALQIQMTDMVKDIADLKAYVEARFEAHLRVHDQDHADRVSGRRWLIGTGIAALTGVGGLYIMLADILKHLYH